MRGDTEEDTDSGQVICQWSHCYLVAVPEQDMKVKWGGPTSAPTFLSTVLLPSNPEVW